MSWCYYNQWLLPHFTGGGYTAPAPTSASMLQKNSKKYNGVVNGLVLCVASRPPIPGSNIGPGRHTVRPINIRPRWAGAILYTWITVKNFSSVDAKMLLYMERNCQCNITNNFVSRKKHHFPWYWLLLTNFVRVPTVLHSWSRNRLL